MPLPHVVMVIPPGGFRDEELLDTKAVLESGGVTVSVASTTIEEVTGMLGAKVMPDELISGVECRNCDGLILVGGSGAVKYFNDSGVHYLVKKAKEFKVVIAAICIAPSILANAGILRGVRATAFPSERNNLESKGAIYLNQGVVRDDKIITAQGPAFAKAFGQEILKALKLH